MNSLDVIADSEPDQSSFVRNTKQPRFVVARGRNGGWIVNDRLGLVGGIFISESAARHFAIEESDRHPNRWRWPKSTPTWIFWFRRPPEQSHNGVRPRSPANEVSASWPFSSVKSS